MKKFLVILLATGLTLTGCSQTPQKKNNNKETTLPVEVTKAIRKNLWEKVELTGDIRGYYEAQVFPKVPGKLKTRIKDVGTEVDNDETIATIDRDEPALEYVPAEVKAPFSGIITRYFASEGETVSPSRPLAEVATIDKVKIVGQISEKDISKISVGQKVEFFVDTYPNLKFYGKVIRLSQVLDALTRTLTVEAVAENPEKKLKPGMFAKVEIFVKAHVGSIVIPRKAVIYNPDGANTIFVVDENNIAHERKVKIGLELIDEVEILSGVKEQEIVVTVGQYNLKEGTPVEVVGGEK